MAAIWSLTTWFMSKRREFQKSKVVTKWLKGSVNFKRKFPIWQGSISLFYFCFQPFVVRCDFYIELYVKANLTTKIWKQNIQWSFVVLRPTCERPENYFCMKMLVFWCFWGEIEIFLVKSRQGVCKSRPKVEICNPWQDFTRKIEISPQSHQKSSIWMQKYVLWLSKVVCNTTENFVA